MEKAFNSKHNSKPVHADEVYLSNGGEMGERIRNFDWLKTSLGAIADWPQTLKTAVNIMLQSPASLAILWGNEGICLYNDAYASIAGRKHPALLGSKVTTVWREVADFVQNSIDVCLQGENLSYRKMPFTILRGENPEDVWMDLDCSPINDDNGIPSGVLIVHTEVTQQVLAEQRQKRAEGQFDVAMDAAGMVGTWDWDIEKDIVYSDPRFASLFSVDPDKGKKGAPMSEYLKGIKTEDVERVATAMDEAIIKRKNYSEEYRLVQKDGTERWIIAKGKCFYDEENKPFRFSGVAVDITDRKKMEDVLRESQGNFSSIFNQASVGIAQVDLDGKFNLVNDGFCKIVGRSKDELYKLKFIDITHSDDLEQNRSFVETTKEHGVPFKMEKRYIRPNGTSVWVNINVSSVKDEEDKPAYLISVCHDITERKLAEKALAFQSKITKVLTNNATVAMFMLDGKGNTTFANPAAEKMTGYKLHEMKQKVLHDLVHYMLPDGSDFHMETCLIGKTIFTQGHLRNHEDMFIRKDGTFFPVLCSASAIREGSKIIGVILEVQDITERKKAEHALKESEQRFRIMANAAPSFVWALNPDTSIKYVNNYILDFLGISEEKVLKGDWSKYIHPDDIEVTTKTITDAFREKKIYSLEHRLLRKDGTFRWLLTKGGPSYFLNGELYGYIGSSVDITEHKLTEKALELKNKQLIRINNDLDNFIYTASHDLKSPISNIEGLVGALHQLLDERTKNRGEISEIVGMIHKSIDRFKNTIKDLTEVAKVQNNIEEDISEVSFKQMLEDVKQNIKRDIDESHAVIIDDFSQAPVIYFSKKNVRSILYNLVSNAIKYRSPERPVKINIATTIFDKDYVLLTVQDNGLGIKEQDKNKIFTMFKRLHQHVEGTGIGLAIVKKIIDNSGGKIEVESQKEKGTLFKVFFKV